MAGGRRVAAYLIGEVDGRLSPLASPPVAVAGPGLRRGRTHRLGQYEECGHHE